LRLLFLVRRGGGGVSQVRGGRPPDGRSGHRTRRAQQAGASGTGHERGQAERACARTFTRNGSEPTWLCPTWFCPASRSGQSRVIPGMPRSGGADSRSGLTAVSFLCVAASSGARVAGGPGFQLAFGHGGAGGAWTRGPRLEGTPVEAARAGHWRRVKHSAERATRIGPARPAWKASSTGLPLLRGHLPGRPRGKHRDARRVPRLPRRLVTNSRHS
jgi:hypothetical protein